MTESIGFSNSAYGAELQPFAGITTGMRCPATRALAGPDMVVVGPPYDHGDITAILAANFAFEFLSLSALQKLGP
jgi:arginase family enzyme